MESTHLDSEAKPTASRPGLASSFVRKLTRSRIHSSSGSSRNSSRSIPKQTHTTTATQRRKEVGAASQAGTTCVTRRRRGKQASLHAERLPARRKPQLTEFGNQGREANLSLRKLPVSVHLRRLAQPPTTKTRANYLSSC
ncbi:unnamed protein product [Ectocarpus fasciculatus]